MCWQRTLVAGLVLAVICVTTVAVAGAHNPESIAVVTGFASIISDPGVASDWYDSEAAYNLYSPLVFPAPNGGIQPHVATEWDAVGGNLAVWQFTIRQDVKFHDGSLLTADDVAFSMERLMALGAGLSGTLGKVLSAEVVAPDKVQFTLEKPNALFPDTLVNFWIVNKDLVLQHIAEGKYGSLGDYGTDWLLTHDAGSGPYVMLECDVNDHLKAERFDDYFLGWSDPEGYFAARSPTAEPIDFLSMICVTEPGTGTAMMRARQIDQSTVWWSSSTMETLTDTRGISIQYYPFALAVVELNTQKPPTDDLHFRRAMAYALDYDGIEAVFPHSEAGSPIPSSFPGYDKNLPLLRRNLDLARAELAQSEYQPGDYPVVIHWCAGVDSEALIIMKFQANLAELGIHADVSPVPWTVLASEIASPETAPNGSCMLLTPSYPSADTFLYYMYHPAVQGTTYSAQWLEDDQLGEWLDQSRLTLDVAERNALYSRIANRIVDLAPVIYAVNAPQPHPTQDYLIGPQYAYQMVGPNLCMWQYRIDLTLKKALMGR